MIILPSMDLSDMYTTMGIILSMYEERLSTRITLDYNAQALDHRLRTPGEEIAFTARPKIHSYSQIFRYSQSIFCLPHRPKFSDFFDFCHHWVSVVRESCLSIVIKLASFVGLQVGTCLVEGPTGMGTGLHSPATTTTRNGRETKKNGANSWRLHHDMTSPAEDVTTGHAAPSTPRQRP